MVKLHETKSYCVCNDCHLDAQKISSFKQIISAIQIQNNIITRINRESFINCEWPKKASEIDVKYEKFTNKIIKIFDKRIQKCHKKIKTHNQIPSTNLCRCGQYVKILNDRCYLCENINYPSP